MKHARRFFFALVVLVPFLSVAQRQASVRALDITRQTSLRDFTLLLVHEEDTTTMAITAENSSFTLLPGYYEVIIQQAGYQELTTGEWSCAEDTATVLIEFRLLKEEATRRETRIGRRNSRKMGIDDSLSPVIMGGFERDRPGRGRHFTAIVYIVTKDSFYTHWVAE